MDNPVETFHDDDAATMAAALFEQGRLVHVATLIATAGTVSLAIISAATGKLYGSNTVLAVGSLVAMLAELWFAMRVAFDAALFRAVAGQKTELHRLDSALVGTGLMPLEKAGRPIEQRIKGGLRLMKAQGFCLLVAMLLLLCCISVAVMSKGGLSL